MIRDATPSDFEAILRLNLESEHFLSPLDRQRLETLHRQAAYHRIESAEGAVEAFLLAFREGTVYDSPNYHWFAERYPTFLYIDRIVVDTAARGKGLATGLYEDLFAWARRSGVPRITCEFDIDPPNEASRRFHQGFGFQEVGSHRVAGGKKAVSLQEVLL